MATLSERLTLAQEAMRGLYNIRRDLVANAARALAAEDWQAAAEMEARNSVQYLRLLENYSGETWEQAKAGAVLMGGTAEEMQAELDVLAAAVAAHAAADRSTEAGFRASCDVGLAAPLTFWR